MLVFIATACPASALIGCLAGSTMALTVTVLLSVAFKGGLHLQQCTLQHTHDSLLDVPMDVRV